MSQNSTKFDSSYENKNIGGKVFNTSQVEVFERD